MPISVVSSYSRSALLCVVVITITNSSELPVSMHHFAVSSLSRQQLYMLLLLPVIITHKYMTMHMPCHTRTHTAAAKMRTHLQALLTDVSTV
jgi:hypothetical protein